MLKIAIERTNAPKKRIEDETKLGFGKIFTDHMFVMDYDKELGWHNEKIIPYSPIVLEPSALVFHYAQECFEGLKAYRTSDGNIQLFRPEKNALRMQSTHKRLAIPVIPVDDFIQAITELVKVDKNWVPSADGTSLYLRPFTIATEEVLGVKSSTKYKFMIIASPSGAYYQSGLKPIKIYVEDEYTRASPGGTGFVKCGGNYAASILASEKAHDKGYDQVLWLDACEKKYVEEVGSMNIFFKIDGEIYTAPTIGTVLPGITRMSCIELLQNWGFKVHEERISIETIYESARKGKLEEVFGTGTAAVITPVGELSYRDENIVVNNDKIGDVTQKLYDELTGIQRGRIEDLLGWTLKIK